MDRAFRRCAPPVYLPSVRDTCCATGLSVDLAARAMVAIGTGLAPNGVMSRKMTGGRNAVIRPAKRPDHCWSGVGMAGAGWTRCDVAGGKARLAFGKSGQRRKAAA